MVMRPLLHELTQICDDNFIWCSVCRVCLPIQTVSSTRPAKLQHMLLNLWLAGCKERLRDGLHGEKGGEATSYPSWTFPLCNRHLQNARTTHPTGSALALAFPQLEPIGSRPSRPAPFSVMG